MVTNPTYLEAIKFIAQILLLIEQLLKSVGQNDVGVVEAAILFIEVIVLVLIVIFFAILLVLSSFVGSILLLELILGGGLVRISGGVARHR